MRFRRTVIALTILIGVSPLVTSALTLDEIKAKLLGILERATVLKVELEKAAMPGVGGQQILPCLSLGRTLRVGMEGEDVQRLQELLIKAGLLAEGKATGYFGSLTEAAVRRWQAQQRIVSSGSAASTGFGVVGPKTRAAILTVCKNQVIASRTANRSCPLPPVAPDAGQCTGTWEEGRDGKGCLTGYECVAASTTPASIGNETPELTPSIAVLAPTSGAVVTGGNTLTIRWNSSNVSAGGSISLLLIDASGNVVGDIASNLAPTGVYLWRVPQGNTDCAEGENAFDCIEKFARCDGSMSICSLEPGAYRIRVSLLQLESISEPFQIAGTAITDLLQNTVGAPVLPAPSTSNAPNETRSLNGCVHDGSTYAEGTTLSVPCQAGACPSETSGYISGTCSARRWCIPQTSYCASTIGDIDVSAYAGGGASSVGSGYNVACPQEGWRAYLACPYGGCTTGWNICRGGVWVLDSAQQTVIVGMQGPCESGQVWCGIGTGFGCVAASQCVNGSAL